MSTYPSMACTVYIEVKHRKRVTGRLRIQCAAAPRTAEKTSIKIANKNENIIAPLNLSSSSNTHPLTR